MSQGKGGMKTYWLLGKRDPDAGYGQGGELQPMCPFTAGLCVDSMSPEDRMSGLSEEVALLPENENIHALDCEGKSKNFVQIKELNIQSLIAQAKCYVFVL